MDIYAWLAIIGTFASICGAVISIREAIRSKNAADKAEKVKDQLIDHRERSELSNLYTLCKRTQQSMEKFGPGSIPNSLDGISPEKESKSVQEFMLSIRENRDLFENKRTNEADRLYKKLNPLLDEFAKSTNNNDLRKFGSEILLLLNKMSSILKKELNIKQETIY